VEEAAMQQPAWSPHRAPAKILSSLTITCVCFQHGRLPAQCIGSHVQRSRPASNLLHSSCASCVPCTCVCPLVSLPCSSAIACIKYSISPHPPTDCTCRASTGPCDVADFCDGKAKTCPTDAKLADGRRCYT
jgi:hypothetical protein